MSEVRITYTSKEEKDKLIALIKANYKIKFISKPYRNFKNKKEEEYRVYIKVEI